MRTDCIFEELYKTRTEPFSSIITGGAPWCHMVFILSSNTPVCTQHSPSLGSRVFHNIAPVRPVLHFQLQHEIWPQTEKISLAVRDGVGVGVAVLGCISVPPAASASPCLARYVEGQPSPVAGGCSVTTTGIVKRQNSFLSSPGVLEARLPGPGHGLPFISLHLVRGQLSRD